VNVETVGQHVEAILDRIGRTSPGALALAEDLLAELMGLYGAGLQRILDRLATADPAALGDLATDPLVAGLMALHDLHPVDLRTRVEQALEQVRPYLGSHGGGVRLLGIEGDTVQLELQGSCDGCGSSAATVQYAVEGAVREAAPEISRIEVAA
jgi:Fe-S cluster biogenesis protein NfuA